MVIISIRQTKNNDCTKNGDNYKKTLPEPEESYDYEEYEIVKQKIKMA